MRIERGSADGPAVLWGSAEAQGFQNMQEQAVQRQVEGEHLVWGKTQTSKYQDNYEFYVVRQKSPLFLGPCCGQTNGPFLAFKGSN